MKFISTILVQAKPTKLSCDAARADWIAAGRSLSSMQLWRRAVSIPAVLLILTLCAPIASAQTALLNGTNAPGTILANTANSYTFAAAAGSSVLLRMSTTTIYPAFDVYAPDGSFVGTASNASYRDALMELTATNAGTYVVQVRSRTAGGSGGYTLRLAEIPGDFVVPAGDEGGAMTSGGNYAGTISPGDLDMWSFSASAGDQVILRVGTISLYPDMAIYGPDGGLVGATFNASYGDALLPLTITNAGTYTVVLQSHYINGDSGTYTLHFAETHGAFIVPAGDEGGAMTSGGNYSGTISPGDVDMWSFSASAGDQVILRVGTISLYPDMAVYGPDGGLVGATFNASYGDALLPLTITNAGTYTVVLQGHYINGDSGTYTLHFAATHGAFIVPSGDEGGAMTSGGNYSGTISIGDLDLWSFDASAGDQVILRVGTSSLYPAMAVYGPDGGLDGSTFNASYGDALLSLATTNAGTYTVVLQVHYINGDSGTYTLHFAETHGAFIVPSGDEGGSMTNGGSYAGTISIGDLDLWSFDANAGDRVILRVGTSSLYPAMAVYGPDGGLDGSTFNASYGDALLSLTITNAGTYTVVLQSHYINGNSGTYTLHLARIPAAFIVPVHDEGGPLANGVTYLATNSVGDLDMWSFVGTPGDSNVLQIVGTSMYPQMDLYGPDGVLVKSAGNGAVSSTLTYVVTNAGMYTVLVQSYYVNGDSGTYTLRYSRVPPDLIVPDTQVLNEGATLNVSISAQDPDLPIKALTFAMLSAPPGVVLTPTGSTNATITWPTDETSGPSTNTIIVSVTDNVAGKDFTRTNSFIVIVNELNEPPVLTVPGQQVINELTPLNVSASATDPDIPANPLTFSLVSPPAGMTIDPHTGAIAWTPTEVQGPVTNTVTVVVTDINPPAVNTTSISVTNSFVVVVREVNLPPQLTVPGNQTITELTPLNVSASATDPDIPANPLTFSLVSPPTGMTIDSNTGAIAWTPSEAQGPGVYTVAVAVTDFNPTAVNAQHLSVTNSFAVTVNESNSPPRFTSVPTNQIITELTSLNVSVAAADDDLPANPLTFALVSPPSGMNINPVTGDITWTPTEAQGPGFYTVTVTVTDTNPAAINQKQFTVTTNFTVTVNESNSPPVLTVPGPQTLDELTTLNVSASSTDSDIPANPLTFALISPPSGMSINPSSGAITWTPTEAQGPGVYTITVTMTDTNRDAINQKSFTVTNSFMVTVNESNSPPVLQPIANRSSHYGVPLSIQAVVTDVDLPTNTLAFSLDLFPSNMTINATSGLISWTPVLAQLGTNTITVRVTDNGVPPKFDTTTFMVVVTGNAPVLAITPLPGNLKQVIITGDVGLNYDLLSSSNLLNWELLLNFSLTTSPKAYIDPDSSTTPRRFYRLRLAP
jgi:uncharacterized protein YqiB (DUF1249 family)